MIDRQKAPKVQTIDQLNFVTPKKTVLTDTVNAYSLDGVGVDAFKLELVFKAGAIYERKLIAKLTSDLLFTGTKTKSSDELDEAIERLGGFLGVDVTSETATVSLFGLVEYFEPLTKIIVDAIDGVVFPEKEMRQTVQFYEQKFLVSKKKVAVQARRKFLSIILEPTSYANQIIEDDFLLVHRDDIINFYKKHYLKGLEKVSLVGDIDKTAFASFLSTVKPWVNEGKFNNDFSFPAKSEEVYIEKEDAVQSAIRVGKVLFNRTHEEYPSFAVLNTLLGGYFGSRLMKNLREDKGYTYGIGSGIAQFLPTGYFFISTEVGKNVREKALNEIKIEIERLQNEKVEQDELEMVKSYMIGKLLEGSDGSFAMMNRFLAVENYGLDFSYYDRFLKTIQTIEADDLQKLAQRHLKWEDLTKVTVG